MMWCQVSAVPHLECYGGYVGQGPVLGFDRGIQYEGFFAAAGTRILHHASYSVLCFKVFFWGGGGVHRATLSAGPLGCQSGPRVILSPSRRSIPKGLVATLRPSGNAALPGIGPITLLFPEVVCLYFGSPVWPIPVIGMVLNTLKFSDFVWECAPILRI